MKKMILILSFIGMLAGCAYYQDRISAANECLGDPACKKQVDNQRDFWKTVGEGSGLPFAGAAAGTLATALFLFFAKKKKELPK